MKVYQIKEIQPVFTRLNNLYAEKEILKDLKRKIAADDHDFTAVILMYANNDKPLSKYEMQWELSGFDSCQLDAIREMRMDNIARDIERCVSELMDLGIEVESD